MAIVLLALGCASTGCGGGTDVAEVRAVSERFAAAVEAQDGERACAHLSPQTRAQLEEQEQRQCREAITGVRLERLWEHRGGRGRVGPELDHKHLADVVPGRG